MSYFKVDLLVEFVGLAQVADLSVEKLEISNLYETNYEEAARRVP